MASVTMPELRCRQQEGRSAPHASSPQPSCKRSSYGLSNMEVFRKVGAIAKDRLGYEFVTGAVDGFEMHRMRRVSLQFVPQLEHVVIHRPSKRIVLVAPNLTQKLF